MKPDLNWLAETHAACFSSPRPWVANEFAALLNTSGTVLVSNTHGFVLAQAVVDEAEILTIAVLPHSRQRGVGAKLLAELEGELIGKGCKLLHLEVGENNTAALALYYSGGFRETGRRSGYYASQHGAARDALILSKPIN